MNAKAVGVQQAVAKKLCRVAAFQGCSVCEGRECEMWQSFMEEADAAINVVRDYFLLTPRKKPRA